jgi:hypothetical protein
MSNTPNVGGDGVYEGYEARLKLTEELKKLCDKVKGRMPKGISFKLPKEVRSEKYRRSNQQISQWD